MRVEYEQHFHIFMTSNQRHNNIVPQVTKTNRQILVRLKLNNTNIGVQECFENAQQRLERLMDNLHRQLLQLRHHKHSTPTTTTTTADDDNDDDDELKSLLKSFDDAVFSLLRQGAAQRYFSAPEEVTQLFAVSIKVPCDCTYQEVLNVHTKIQLSYK